MSFRLSHLVVFLLMLSGLGAALHAGISADTPYTNRGKTDFDTILQLLNPYGTWSKIDGKWAFTPRDHQAPYTNGRWIYTEYGWYWKGTLPHSWATEHYGYWKRSGDKVWSWFPGPYWLPEIVEIRASDKYLGWRSGEVDSDGSFVEQPIDRYSKPDEWTFVTLAQFANPITPAIVAPTNVAKDQLDISTECRHTYLTYREIDRPGPHPADFADLCKDGGMLAPKTIEDDAAIQPKPDIVIPGYTPTFASTNNAAHMTGTNAPALLGPQIDPSADTRKVKYWITMSLPSFWSKPPPDAKATEIYLYRPDIYQDDDGIERRITLWFNPNARTSLKDILGKNMPGAARPEAATGAATPATPAVPAQSDQAHNPFRSPFEDPFHPASPSHSNSSSTKGPTPAPAGTNSADAPIPSPLTNAAPAQ
jgi:hypothetical protein